MSPRRALATAAIMAVVPTCIFFSGTSKYSLEICNQIAQQSQASLNKEEGLRNECIKTIKKSYWSSYYWVLLATILINWPVIRWLDDRQWYKEWIREEGKNN